MLTKLTPEIITAAILGFEEQKRHIDGQTAELRAILSGGPARSHCCAGSAHPQAPESFRGRTSKDGNVAGSEMGQDPGKV